MSIHKSEEDVDRLMCRLETVYCNQNFRELAGFKTHLESRNVGVDARVRYLYGFWQIRDLIDFRLTDASWDEHVSPIVAEVNTGKVNGTDYSAHSKAEIRNSLRQFYKWKNRKDIYENISTHVPKSDQPSTDPDTLPKQQHIEQMLENATNTRDKAFIHTLWDSAMRISAFLELDWRDITFRDGLAVIRVRNGKTGSRTIPCGSCVDDLREYLEEYRGMVDNFSEELPVWVKFRTRSNSADGMQPVDRMPYSTARLSVLKRTGDKAGLPDRIGVNPHNFRKGRATDLARRGFNAFQLCEYCGWESLEVAKRYIRLAEADVEAAVRDMVMDSGSSSAGQMTLDSV